MFQITKSFMAILVVLAISHATDAATFVDNFDMKTPANYTQYLYSTSNAQVWNETPSFPDVFYWGPSSTNLTGTVEYRYQFSTPITSASIFAELVTATNYDPSSTIYLDVSPDGTNWQTIADATTQWSVSTPIDISALVDGSDDAYIRARMFETTSFGNIQYSQFLRSGNPSNTSAPNVYQFTATTEVPEPASIALLATIVAGLCRRRRA